MYKPLHINVVFSPYWQFSSWKKEYNYFFPINQNSQIYCVVRVLINIFFLSLGFFNNYKFPVWSSKGLRNWNTSKEARVLTIFLFFSRHWRFFPLSIYLSFSEDLMSCYILIWVYLQKAIKNFIPFEVSSSHNTKSFIFLPKFSLR